MRLVTTEFSSSSVNKGSGCGRRGREVGEAFRKDVVAVVCAGGGVGPLKALSMWDGLFST